MASAPLKQIDGRTFAFGMLAATIAVEVEVFLVSKLGEPLVRLLVAKDDDEAKQLDATTAALGLLMSKLTARDVRWLMDTMFAVTSVDGQKIVFDAVFAGNPRVKYEVLWKALKTNFADFFPGNLSSLIAGALRSGSSPSSQQTSTGSSSGQPDQIPPAAPSAS